MRNSWVFESRFFSILSDFLLKNYRCPVEVCHYDLSSSGLLPKGVAYKRTQGHRIELKVWPE